MPDLGIVLLAAGASSRMGSSKALLPWGEKSLIEYQILRLQSLDYPVYPLLGSDSQFVFSVISNAGATCFVNPNWKEGMSTSMAFAVKSLKDLHKSILFFLVDQPLISSTDLSQLVELHKANPDKIIVSRSSEGWSGPPVIFPEKFYPELMELKGDHGAKPLIKAHTSEIISVELESSMEDMDTPEAYQSLLKKANLQS